MINLKDLFNQRSKIRMLERKVDYLDKKLEAWIMTFEQLYVRKND